MEPRESKFVRINPNELNKKPDKVSSASPLGGDSWVNYLMVRTVVTRDV